MLSSWLILLVLAHRTMTTNFTNPKRPETRNKLWASDLGLHVGSLFWKSGLIRVPCRWKNFMV